MISWWILVWNNELVNFSAKQSFFQILVPSSLLLHYSVKQSAVKIEFYCQTVCCSNTNSTAFFDSLVFRVEQNESFSVFLHSDLPKLPLLGYTRTLEALQDRLNRSRHCFRQVFSWQLFLVNFLDCWAVWKSLLYHCILFKRTCLLKTCFVWQIECLSHNWKSRILCHKMLCWFYCKCQKKKKKKESCHEWRFMEQDTCTKHLQVS